MELIPLCPFAAWTLAWEPRSGEKSVTLGVKGTFSLAHGPVATLAPAQEGAWDDTYWDKDAASSLFTPSDDAPVKPRADILLVGSAFAPGRSPVESLVVRLRVDGFSKALRVTGDRVWAQAPDGPRPSPPRPFAEMPLRYERAAPRGENKLGAQASQGRVAVGLPLPNIDLADDPNPYRTPGFGPLSPRARALRSNLSEDAVMWAHRVRGAAGAAPPGFDFGYFNAAPRDQQVDALRPDAVIGLEGLSPRAAALETRLPGIRPRAFCVDGAGAGIEVALRCDTLWINTDRELAVLVWRGLISGATERAASRLLVAAEGPGKELRFEDVAKLAMDRRGVGSETARRAPSIPPPQAGDRTFVPIPGALPLTGPALPFSPGAAPSRALEESRAEAPKAPPPTRPSVPSDGRATAVPTGAPLKPALPFPADSPPPASPAPPPAAIAPPAAPSIPAAEISVDLCATVAAEIDQGAADTAAILGRHKISAAAWAEARQRWASAIEQEGKRGKRAARDAYDDAYVAQIEVGRGPIQAAEYARLEIAIERSDLDSALAELRLPRPALMPVQRVWLRKLIANVGLGSQVQRAIAAARSA